MQAAYGLVQLRTGQHQPTPSPPASPASNLEPTSLPPASPGPNPEPTPNPPVSPGPNLPARPERAPATAAAVRNHSAPGHVQAAGLPPRPRTPEGGWRRAIPRAAGANPANLHQQQQQYRQQPQYQPAPARRNSSCRRQR